MFFGRNIGEGFELTPFLLREFDCPPEIRGFPKGLLATLILSLKAEKKTFVSGGGSFDGGSWAKFFFGLTKKDILVGILANFFLTKKNQNLPIYPMIQADKNGLALFFSLKKFFFKGKSLERYLASAHA